MRTSISNFNTNFFRITVFVLTFCSFFLQSIDTNAQRTSQTQRSAIKNTKPSISVTKTPSKGVIDLLKCEPNSFFKPYVDYAKANPQYNRMRANITLVSLWNHFTGQANGLLEYNPATCSFVGTVNFTFSDRFYVYPNCDNSGGFNLGIQYPFNPKHTDKAQISINASTGQINLQLWGSKTFKTTVNKGIVNGFENSASMMIAVTAKKEQIPIIK